MKKFFILSLSILALVPAVSGTAVPVVDGATVLAQSSDVSPELLQVLKAQAAASDSTLPRPL